MALQHREVTCTCINMCWSKTTPMFLIEALDEIWRLPMQRLKEPALDARSSVETTMNSFLTLFIFEWCWHIQLDMADACFHFGNGVIIVIWWGTQISVISKQVVGYMVCTQQFSKRGCVQGERDQSEDRTLRDAIGEGLHLGMMTFGVDDLCSPS